MLWTCTVVHSSLDWAPKPDYAAASEYSHWCDFSFSATRNGFGKAPQRFHLVDVTHDPLTAIPFAHRHLVRLIRPGCILRFDEGILSSVSSS